MRKATIKCKYCNEEFDSMIDLGKHICNYNKKAKWGSPHANNRPTKEDAIERKSWLDKLISPETKKHRERTRNNYTQHRTKNLSWGFNSLFYPPER